MQRNHHIETFVLYETNKDKEAKCIYAKYCVPLMQTKQTSLWIKTTGFVGFVLFPVLTDEPPRGKTNNVVSEQV